MKVQDVIEKEPYAVVSIMGMRGAGKTYMTTQLIDVLKVKTDIVIIIDIVGVYSEYLGSGKIVRITKLYSEDVLYRFFNEHVKKGVYVFDISELDRGDMVEIINIISEWLLRKKEHKKTASLIVDEVGEVLEQERGYYAERLESLVRIGRNKRVLYVIVTTQRPQKVNKHALALSDVYVVFKMVHNLDIEAVRNIMGMDKSHFRTIEKTLKTLKIGEYIITDGIKYEVMRRGIVEGKLITEEENKEELKEEKTRKRKKREEKKTAQRKGYTKQQIEAFKKDLKKAMKKGLAYGELKKLAKKHGISYYYAKYWSSQLKKGKR